jgi:hypothetical protein
MTPTSLVREKPVKPTTVRRSQPARRPVIVTRAELAPCTCPEHCERDHENE